MTQMTRLIVVRLPRDLLRLARRKARARGRTLDELIAEGLRLVLRQKRKTARKQRLMPRVSTAHGGLTPGFDLDDGSVIQEMYDLEYVERMKGTAP